ncbi:hypothetical protein K438DRAFT_1845065 [Mycena galopus ATCC 62051]|nr:hypothetical protein K438DRAFT_1845065 [Mycena galopus ATCC 62051]
MDQPSWNDTLRATLGSCLPCLPCGPSRANTTSNGSGDSEDEYSNNNGVRGIRRARSDELEGLLVDSNSADEGWRDDDAAADADAISLHSHLGPRGASAHPHGRVALEGGDDALHPSAPTPPAGEAGVPKRNKRRGSGRSTDDLLARAALDAGPTQLKDVTSADVARRARTGSSASQGVSEGGETDLERRARRKARKEMRRLAAALAEAPHTPDSGEFEGFPGSGDLPPAAHRGIPAPFLQLSSAPPDALAHLQAADDDEAADLDGLAYARLAPRAMGSSQSQSRSSGRSSGSGSGAPYSPVGVGDGSYDGQRKKSKSKSKSKRSNKSQSSATSSTLASPPPTSSGFPHTMRDSDANVRDSAIEVDDSFGAFAHAQADEDFDGTPGGFTSTFGVGEEAEVVREALPSPGLSRGGGGFRFGGAKMGGF